MTPPPLALDTAHALLLGARERQEDSLLVDFPLGRAGGYAVLADGMGGEGNGEIASQLVLFEASFGLHELLRAGPEGEARLRGVLQDSIDRANGSLAENIKAAPRLRRMGSTLLMPVIFDDRLWWGSVGDSPLYLWRDGVMEQINQDHSALSLYDPATLTPEELREAAAQLTSAVTGGTIERIDLPQQPTQLRPGDVVIAASDGLQFLDEARIARIVADSARAGARAVCAALIAAIKALDAPDQDNVSLLVICCGDPAPAPKPARIEIPVTQPATSPAAAPASGPWTGGTAAADGAPQIRAATRPRRSRPLMAIAALVVACACAVTALAMLRPGLMSDLIGHAPSKSLPRMTPGD